MNIREFNDRPPSRSNKQKHDNSQIQPPLEVEFLGFGRRQQHAMELQHCCPPADHQKDGVNSDPEQGHFNFNKPHTSLPTPPWFSTLRALGFDGDILCFTPQQNNTQELLVSHNVRKVRKLARVTTTPDRKMLVENLRFEGLKAGKLPRVVAPHLPVV